MYNVPKEHRVGSHTGTTRGGRLRSVRPWYGRTLRSVTGGRLATGGGAAYVGTGTSGGGLPSRGGMASVGGCASVGRQLAWCVHKDGAQMALRPEGWQCIQKDGTASGRMVVRPEGWWCVRKHGTRTVVRLEGRYKGESTPSSCTGGRASVGSPGARTQSTGRDGLRYGAVSSKAAEATRATGGPGRGGFFSRCRWGRK